MKAFFLFCSMAAAGLFASEEGLLLHSSFDKYNTTPDFYSSPTIKAGGITNDLQLRMFPNFKGSGNSVCLNNKEYVSYTQPGNFRTDCGTVSFWVNLQNWDLSDTTANNSLFEVSTGVYRMIVYKYKDHRNRVTFYLQHKDKVCSVTASADWKRDTWHKLDAVWDSSGMHLYVDAQLKEAGQSAKFPPGMVLPESIRGGVITLNSQAHWRHNPNWTTAYDDLKIYDRCLSGDEIVAAYEKYFPRNFEGGAKPGHAVIPPTTSKVAIDGKLDDSEWENASAVPIVNHLASPSNDPVFSRALMQYDKDMLYLAFQVNAPAKKCEATKADGELWLDDSVEFHTTGADNTPRQFIFNANGAVYDSMKGKADWNAGVKAAGGKTENPWCVEAAIPLSALGNPAVGSVIKGNFGSTQWTPNGNYHSWNFIYGYCKGFSSPEFFGDLTFGKAQDSVQIVCWGNPIVSALELRLQGKPGMKTSASWEAETGASAKSTLDLFRNTWTVDLPSGRNIVTTSVKNQNGKEIYRHQACVKVNQAFAMNYTCYASRKLLKVDLQQKKAASGGTSCELKLVDAKGSVLAKQNCKLMQEQNQFDFPLPENLVENAVYTLEATAGNVTRKQTLRVPDMTPYKNRVAADHLVPEPWVPVTVSGNEYKLLNRSYIFADGPFPTAMLAEGKPVLAKQPVLMLNGNPVKWDAIVPGANNGEHADFTAKGSCGTAKFLCKGEVWFDGMYRWDLTMIPPADGLKIQSFALDWTMTEDASRYVLHPYYTPWINGQANLKWAVDERSSIVWLTGTEQGLAWWCKSDANWVIDVNKPQIFCSRNGKETAVRAEIIQKPSTLNKEASYTMVFQATPPRQLDTSFRDLREHGWGSGDINCSIRGWAVESGVKNPANILYWTSMIPAYPEEFKQHFQEAKDKGILALIYSMPAHMPQSVPDHDYFYPEWAVTPGIRWSYREEFTGNRAYTEPCCALTPGSDWQIYYSDKLLKENPGLGGIYFDICHVQSCDNALHGCGGVDAFGKKYRSSTALSLRDFFLRMNKITHRKGRKLWLHAHNAFYPFVHDFGDLWLPGEEQFYPFLRNPEKHYLTGISKEEYQSALNPKVHGVGIMFIAQNARVLTPELQKHRERYTGLKAINRVLMVLYLYDLNLEAGKYGNENQTVFPFWAVRKNTKIQDAVFHGYWEDNAISSKVPDVYVSRYSWNTPSPYSELLAIGNYSDKDSAPALQIDWKQLKASPESKWFNPLTGAELDKTKLVVPAEGFLLIGLK